MRRHRFVFPFADEQTAIARYLDHATTTIDHTVELTLRQIALFKEYRARLIADVVTGKLDVRDSAAALPKVDPLAGDDMDHPVDIDVDSVLEDLEAITEVTI